MIFYDSHAHCIQSQNGGFLIGIEGEAPKGTSLNNNAVQIATQQHPSFLPAYYITRQYNTVPDETILKYHPRREQYTPAQVSEDLQHRTCKLCIIDTLNQPYWNYTDYWHLAKVHTHTHFLLAHMGGYDIVNFIKILDFCPNVWGDFAMTQEYFGWCGSRPTLHYVAQAIDYCLAHPKLNQRILFGSDEPDFSQTIALQKYAHLPNANDILINNYKKLITIL